MTSQDRAKMRPDPPANADSIAATFAAQIEGLGLADLKVVHLAMHRAMELETQGRGAEGEALLISLLRLVSDD